MTNLSAALGYDQVALDIATGLAHGTDIAVIQGPPGVGKSWLAKGVGTLWEDSGGRTLVAEGDQLQSDAAFYPLNLALAKLSNAYRSVATELAQVSASAEQVAGTAGMITATIQALVRLRPSRQRARKLYLGPVEQGILFELERLADRRPLLLIADNLHWWDQDSLKLLGRLREAAMGEAFPFLAEMRVIVAQTVEPYQDTINPEARDALLQNNESLPFSLARPSRSRFPDVLTALGVPPALAAAAANDVYDLTGGHLALATRCARRLRETGDEFLGVIAAGGDFTRKLLTDRVRALGSVGSSALAMLQIAAILGLNFRRTEVTCAFEGKPADVSRLLRDCRDEDIIELTEDAGRFVHDLFRQHFLESNALDSVDIHETLSKCLRELRPGDYITRCRHLSQAERIRDAAILGVQAALQRHRDGVSWRDLPEHTILAIRNGEQTQAVDVLVKAMEYLSASKYASCLETLRTLPRGLSRNLAAEADYIEAEALICTRSEAARESSQAMLEGWSGFEKTEPELGMRLMLLHLYCLTLIVDKQPGRRLEAEIKQVLLKRGDFDQAAEDAWYTLDRCSGSLHEPDAALPRIREAAKYFGPKRGQSVIRRPVEYYRCMVNLGAHLVMTAAYDEALEVHTEIETLVAEYTPGTFSRLDYFRTTALLAEFRLAMIDATVAAERQETISAAEETRGDPFYPDNALAVYMIMAGANNDGIQVFDTLEDELVKRPQPAPSVDYLVRANRCAARYCMGECDAAIVEWAELRDVCERIPYPVREYLIRRHDLLHKVMRAGEVCTPKDFDECLLALPRFGPFWDQVGRGFWMPEVEWWN